MHHYTQGKPTRQGHKGIPEGHYEEEQGLKGFFGPVSHLIKPEPSTRWKIIEGPLKPHMYDLVKLDVQPGWRRLLYNQQVGIYQFWMEPQQKRNFIGHRNADGDTLYFCHEGAGVVLSEYGLLNFSKGMYIVIPKCLTHTILPSEKSFFFIVENRNSTVQRCSHLQGHPRPARAHIKQKDLRQLLQLPLEARDLFYLFSRVF